MSACVYPMSETASSGPESSAARGMSRSASSSVREITRVERHGHLADVQERAVRGGEHDPRLDQRPGAAEATVGLVEDDHPHVRVRVVRVLWPPVMATAGPVVASSAASPTTTPTIDRTMLLMRPPCRGGRPPPNLRRDRGGTIPRRPVASHQVAVAHARRRASRAARTCGGSSTDVFEPGWIAT